MSFSAFKALEYQETYVGSNQPSRVPANLPYNVSGKSAQNVNIKDTTYAFKNTFSEPAFV